MQPNLFLTTLHYWLWLNGDQIIITIIGSFIGVITAISIFLFSQSSQRKQDETKLNKRHKQSIDHYIYLLKNCYKVFKQQTVDLQDYSQRKAKRPLTLEVVENVASADFERIMNIDTETLFHAFTDLEVNTEDIVILYRRSFAQLDYIKLDVENQYSSIQKHVFNHSDKRVKLKDTYENLADSVAMTLGQLKRGEQNYLTNDLYQFLNKKILQYHKIIGKREVRFEDIYSQFSNPIRKVLVEKFQDNPEVDHLIYQCKRTSSIMLEISYSSTEFAKELSTSIKQIRKYLKKLKKTISKLETIKKGLNNS